MNHINKNEEKKINGIFLKIYSLNNFINEFEKLIQTVLEFLLYLQESLNQSSGCEIINDNNNELVNKDYLNYNLLNLDFADKLNPKEYSISSQNFIDNNSRMNNFSNNYSPNNLYMNKTYNNFRNYNSLNKFSSEDSTNKFQNSLYIYNNEQYFPYLKKKTLMTLYNQQYNQFKNNFPINDRNNINEIDYSGIKIPIRKTLRALIKEKKLNKNYINNNINENDKINKEEDYKLYFAENNENDNNINFETNYKNSINQNEFIISKTKNKFDKIDLRFNNNEQHIPMDINKSKTPSGNKRKFIKFL